LRKISKSPISMSRRRISILSRINKKKAKWNANPEKYLEIKATNFIPSLF